MKLKGKTALVTGSASRIGRCIAWKLAEHDVDVIIHARQQSSDADAAVKRIQQMGRNTELTLHDLSDCNGTARWFEELCQRYDGIDILINSASDYTEDTYDNMTISSLNTAMAVQVFSPLVMMRTMRQWDRPGAVVNILDTRFKDRDPAHAAYHLAKRSLHTITRDLAVAYSPAITVNAVAPGIILPPKNHSENWLKRMAKTTPLATYGSPDDVAKAVLYLVQAPFITGEVIFVDGGRHLKGHF